MAIKKNCNYDTLTENKIIGLDKFIVFCGNPPPYSTSSSFPWSFGSFSAMMDLALLLVQISVRIDVLSDGAPNVEYPSGVYSCPLENSRIDRTNLERHPEMSHTIPSIKSWLYFLTLFKQ